MLPYAGFILIHSQSISKTVLANILGGKIQFGFTEGKLKAKGLKAKAQQLVRVEGNKLRTPS